LVHARLCTAVGLCITAIGCGGGGGAAGPAPVASVSVSVEKTTLLIGETMTATATTKDAAGGALSGRAISWSTSNPNVLTVSPVGLVTAVAPGGASIVATSESIVGTAIVTVALPPVASLVVSLGASTLSIGGMTQATATARDAGGNILTGRLVNWSSDNGTVATVTSTGLVIANKGGNANITAVVESKVASALLIVNPPVIGSATVSLASPTGIGTTTQATVKFKDTDENPINGTITGWSSDNTSVATVNASGVVTSVGLGTANISVTSNGPTASAPMTVSPLVGFGSSSEKIRILDIGATFTPTLTGSSAGSTTFTSRATSVVRVNAAGTLTGVGEGQGWVAATASGFASDSVYVIVPRNSTGPLLRTDLTPYDVKAGTTVTFNVILDTRSTPIGGAELTVGYTANPLVFTSVDAMPTGTPAPVISNLQGGLFRLSLASGSALSGQLSILRFTFTAPVTSGVELIANRSGYVILTLMDLVDPAGADLLPVSTSMRVPIIITQ
jgi:uncharacterized protein YjdB